MNCTVHGVAESRTRLSDFYSHFSLSKGAEPEGGRLKVFQGLLGTTFRTILHSGVRKDTLVVEMFSDVQEGNVMVKD